MTFKYCGYKGRILWISLTKKMFKEVKLDPPIAEKFIGGRGLGAKLLFNFVGPEIHPLDPDNKLIFLTGPLAGTRVFGSCRFVITTKSPLTGIYMMSICGGGFASEIKFAGYDGLVVEGKARTPTYVLIEDGMVDFRDASHLWGLTTTQTQEVIRNELKGLGEVVCIGPAGERLVKIASIVNGYRQAARGGVGAVMGSKNLKAISVIGSGDVTVYDIDMLETFLLEARSLLRERPYRKHFSIYGTMEAVSINNSYGAFPTRNFQQGVFEYADELSGENVRDEFVVKDVACKTCALACSKVTVVKDGPYRGAIAHGPDYETIWAFGPQCGNRSFESVVYANMLCDELGLDTMSTGNVIGFAMECYEKGLLNKKDTCGIELRFGNHEAIIELIKQIAYRRGLGNILAEGVRTASQYIGHESERFAMHVKGLELGAYDPRGFMGMALAYAVGNRGGCHHSMGVTIPKEIVGKGRLSADYRFEADGKGMLVKELAEERIIYDCLMVCTFQIRSFGYEIPVKLLYAVTGMRFDIAGLKKVGDRINTLERAFNVREGITSKDDTLPRRILEEPLPSGPARGRYVDPKLLNLMLKDYYEEMGWSENGVPRKTTLKNLDIGDVADDLERRGLIE